jgi:FkbM family methyltransferase
MEKGPRVDRRNVLLGSLAGVTLGGPVGFMSGSLSQRGATSSAVAPFVADGARTSYAQQGEDLVVKSILASAGITKPSYIDIGAHHPSINNNSYLFYQAGGRGVLVEPNPVYAKLLREQRPEDTVVEAGIGVTNESEAEYYVIRGDGQLNTFSKEQVDELVRRGGSKVVVEVIKRPLLKVDDVLAKHFAIAPDFFSIDVEGLDYEILKTLDFGRFRAKVFCVETSQLDGRVHQGILELLVSKDYAVRGGSHVNTVFVDQRLKL